MANSLIASGTNITLYDVTTTPFAQLTHAEGAPARKVIIEDQVAVPAIGFATAGNYVKLCRFPTFAKVKKVELFTDLSLIDGGTTGTTLVLNTGVMFSDGLYDGTPVGYRGLAPTTVGIGGSTTTPGTAVAINGTSCNYIFGTITAVTTTGAMPSSGSAALSQLFGGEITFNGTIATYGEPLAIDQNPLIDVFNFRDGQNKLIPSLGMFDIFVMASTGYKTVPAAAYNIFVRVEAMV